MKQRFSTDPEFHNINFRDYALHHDPFVQGRIILVPIKVHQRFNHIGGRLAYDRLIENGVIE